MKIPEHKPHYLKSEIQRRGLKLWQVKKLLGKDAFSEGKLSRCLNGIDEMPAKLEIALKKIMLALGR